MNGTKKFFKGLTTEEVCHYVLLSISILFCITMYRDMLFPLLCACVVFEFLKPKAAAEAISNWSTNKGKSVGYFILTGILIFFSLNAIASDMTNDYFRIRREGTRMIKTDEWKAQEKLENETKSEKERLEKEVKNYPTLESALKGVPVDFITEKRNIRVNWKSNKDKLTSDYNTAKKDYKEAVNGYKGLKKYSNKKIEVFKSYTKYFNIVGKYIGVNPDYLFIILSFLIGCMLEAFIMVSKAMSVKARRKKEGTYQLTEYEMLDNYKNMMIQNSMKQLMEKVGIASLPSINVIEEKGFEEIEEPKEIETPKLKKSTTTATMDRPEQKSTLERGRSEFFPSDNEDSPAPHKTIGFKPEKEEPEKKVEVKKETPEKIIDLKKAYATYLDFQFENLDSENFGIGKRDTIKRTGISNRNVNTIWDKLNMIGATEKVTKGNIIKTRFVKSKSEIKKLLAEYFTETTK